MSYRIMGNFGEVFYLVNWRNRQIKNLLILFHTLSHYVEALAIAKFKIRQYIRTTDSPNLMLAKVSRYTVYIASQPRTTIVYY